MSLYENIKALQPYARLKWPGTDHYFRLYIANQEVIKAAALETERIFKDVAIGVHNMEMYRQEKQLQIFYRIFRTDDNKTVCSMSEFRKLITPDLFEWLDDEHEVLQDKHAPVVEEMSQKDFDKLIEDLKKKPEETLLDNYSIHTLRRVCLHLVSPAPILQAET